jgi:hypothetical protein
MTTVIRGPAPNPNPQPQPGDGSPVDGTPGYPSQDFDNEGEAPFEPQALLERIIGWFKTDRDHFQQWRQESAECYNLVAGHQWGEEDLEILADQLRPAVTFNRVAPFIDTVSGLEISNRQETTFIPRQLGSSGKSELLSSAASWVRDECDAEDEESESFRDVLICGVGCTQTLMNYDDDPDGVVEVARIDPLEMLPDASSRKQNYADARHVLRIKDVSVATAMDMFPDVPIDELNATWAQDELDETQSPHNARLAPYYRIDQAGEIDRQKQLIRIVEVEWWDYEPAFRVLDPVTGRFIRLSEKEAMTYRVRAELLAQTQGLPKPDIIMMKDKQKKFWKALVGARVLRILNGPEDGGFTYKFITGKRDRNKAVWYGLVRAMRDPQLWANKFFSQSLHIINTNAKGGLLAEEDAFANPDEARDSWAEADSITMLNPGGLAKVKQKEPPAFPAMINNLMQFAIEAIPGTSGINMEMVALADRVQPGVLEMQRKQQGMTVLASIFNAFRRYRKEQGRLLLWFITEFIADGRLIRIGGPENMKYVQLIHEPGTDDYDVIVDDAPSSPNMKEKTWSTLMAMFPMLRGMPIPPQTIMAMLKYAPLPQALLSEVSEQMEKQGQQPPQLSPVDQAKMQLMQAQGQKMQADAARAGADAQKAQVEAALMPQKLSSDVALTQARQEHLRASAVNELQNAGLDQYGQDREAAKQNHDQMMDVATHSLDVAKHNLDVHQAFNPPTPTTPQQSTGGI